MMVFYHGSECLRHLSHTHNAPFNGMKMTEKKDASSTAHSKPRPEFQRPSNPKVALIANGWIEQQRRSKMRTVWKDVLASLVEGRKPGEETTLWIQRQITNANGKPELEALHQIPVKWLQEVTFLDYSVDNRFSLRVYNLDEDFVFRCPKDPGAAENWVMTLLSARDAAIRKKSDRKPKREAHHDEKKSADTPRPIAERARSPPAASTDPPAARPTPRPAPAGEPRPPASSKKVSIKELRALAHGAGINTHGMERGELERVVAELAQQHQAAAPPSKPQPPPPDHPAEPSPDPEAERRAQAEAERRRREEEALEAERKRQEEERQRVLAARVHAQQEALRKQKEEEEHQRLMQERQKRDEEELHRRAAQQQAEQKRREQEAAARREQEEFRRRQEAWQQQQAEEERRRAAEQQRQQEAYQRHMHWQQQQQQSQTAPSSGGAAAPPPPQWQQPNQHAQPPPQYPFPGYGPQQQHQQPPPNGFYGQHQQQQQQQQQQHHSAVNDKYAKMAAQEDDNTSIQRIKHAILIHWALQPPMRQSLRPIEDLVTSIHTVFPPAFGVPGHEYFQKWKGLGASDVDNDDKLEKKVKKLRFFLHPDKLPKDLNTDQSFMCRMLWDITSDALEEHKTKKEDLSWIHH